MIDGNLNLAHRYFFLSGIERYSKQVLRYHEYGRDYRVFLLTEAQFDNIIRQLPPAVKLTNLHIMSYPASAVFHETRTKGYAIATKRSYDEFVRVMEDIFKRLLEPEKKVSTEWWPGKDSRGISQ